MASTPGQRSWLSRIPRPRAHWTPRYVINRIRQGWWERRNPTLPWLTRDAVAFLEEYLRPGDTVVEFGAGRSTMWFSRKVGSLGRIFSVEHNPAWHGEVQRRIAAAGTNNVKLALASNTAESVVGSAAAMVANRSADLVLVDSVQRDSCALWALEAVRLGGCIAIDNVQRYLPHETHCPHAIPANGQPATVLWATFWARTEKWRRYWTTDGINDTAFFFCPAGA